MLNRHARNAVSELARAGVDDLTADEIVRLHVLGEAFDRATAETETVSSPPVRVGDMTLWPLTCAAEDWLDEAETWFDERPVARFWALPLAMVHAREPSWFQHHAADPDAALVAIHALHQSIAATDDEVFEAVRRVFRLRESVDREEARAALLAWTDWAERTDPAGNWQEMRERGLAALRAGESPAGPDEATEAAERGFEAWRVYCVDLAVLTGTDPDYWYRQDVRLCMHAMAKAQEARRARDGAVSGRQSFSRRQADALLAIRAAVAEIRKSRGKG